MSNQETWDSWLQGAVAKLHGAHLLRSLRPIAPSQSHNEYEVEQPDPPSPVDVCLARDTLNAWLADEPSTGGLVVASTDPSVDMELRSVKLFSTNDYLGLSAHPAVAKAVSSHACLGMGPRASALVAGYTMQQRELEHALANLKETEDCLLFPSGFSANTAVVYALCSSTSPSPPVAIFSDELNHASIVDGARLAKSSGATLHVYRHADTEHLERLLRASPAPRKMVVTDSVFSMDGDVAPLARLAELRCRLGFLLVVDEAHATLVYGARGGGAAEAAGVARSVDVHVGTLSKAFGSLGGFVACTTRMKQYLLTRGRAFVYSTALPVPVVAAAFAALQTSLREPRIRERLWERIRQLGDAIGRNLEGPIVALMVGDELTALQISKKLLQMGYHVPAIRPPTVPNGTSRLRIALSAAHTEQDVADLVRALHLCGALEIAKQFELWTRDEGSSRAPGGALMVEPAAKL